MEAIPNRKDQLSKLNGFIDRIDKELTLVLQKFNWDRKHVLQGEEMVFCKYDSNHRIPVSRRESHEHQCFLTKHGYQKDDKFLPDPPCDSRFMIKFTPQEINKIIEDAARNDPYFKRGVRGDSPPPLRAERLQCAYTSDERRALYDVVIATAPAHMELDDTDLTLLGNTRKSSTREKSREEVLAELRNMKRRRTKYRVAPKTKNYSDVLRDVIQAQMESYNEAQAKIKIKQEKHDDGYEDNANYLRSRSKDSNLEQYNRRRQDEYRYSKNKEDGSIQKTHENYRKRTFDRRENTRVTVKVEREEYSDYRNEYNDKINRSERNRQEGTRKRYESKEGKSSKSERSSNSDSRELRTSTKYSDEKRKRDKERNSHHSSHSDRQHIKNKTSDRFKEIEYKGSSRTGKDYEEYYRHKHEKVSDSEKHGIHRKSEYRHKESSYKETNKRCRREHSTEISYKKRKYTSDEKRDMK